jgi:ACYPI007078 protein
LLDLFFFSDIGGGGESAEDKEKLEELERERLEALREAEERRQEKHRKLEEEREKMRQGVRNKVNALINA